MWAKETGLLAGSTMTPETNKNATKGKGGVAAAQLVGSLCCVLLFSVLSISWFYFIEVGQTHVLLAFGKYHIDTLFAPTQKYNTTKVPFGVHNFRRVVPHVVWESEDDWLHPKDFFKKHIESVYTPGSSEGGAVLFKGMAKVHPAYKKWSIDYLAKTIGNATVRVERLLEDRCTNELPVESWWEQAGPDSPEQKPKPKMQYQIDGEDLMGGVQESKKWDHKYHRDCSLSTTNLTTLYNEGENTYMASTFANYLLKSKKEALYAISEVPEALHEDVLVPSSILCNFNTRHLSGGYTEEKKNVGRLYEVDFWLSVPPNDEHGTSVFHYDMNHAVMCLYKGRKDWIIVDPRNQMQYMDFLQKRYFMISPWDIKGSDWADFNQEFVSEEDLKAYKKVDVQFIRQEAGDCLYVPPTFPHQTRTYGTSIAISMLWHKYDGLYDPENCEGLEHPAQKHRLKDMDLTWTYPGKYRPDGNIPMPGFGKIHLGFGPWVIWRDTLANTLELKLDDVKDEKLRVGHFIRAYGSNPLKNRYKRFINKLKKRKADELAPNSDLESLKMRCPHYFMNEHFFFNPQGRMEIIPTCNASAENVWTDLGKSIHLKNKNDSRLDTNGKLKKDAQVTYGEIYGPEFEVFFRNVSSAFDMVYDDRWLDVKILKP